VGVRLDPALGSRSVSLYIVRTTTTTKYLVHHHHGRFRHTRQTTTTARIKIVESQSQIGYRIRDWGLTGPEITLWTWDISILHVVLYMFSLQRIVDRKIRVDT